MTRLAYSSRFDDGLAARERAEQERLLAESIAEYRAGVALRKRREFISNALYSLGVLCWIAFAVWWLT